MGIHANIGIDKFPKQGNWIGKKCNVCFDYDSTRMIPAECVRDDSEQPGLTIFKLNDGRYVLSTECMHSMPQ